LNPRTAHRSASATAILEVFIDACRVCVCRIGNIM